jgi:quinol-cytochrome oxidoreductase complex cytochrome b subunit
LALIDSVVYLGRFVRALHYWAAQVMVVAAVIHTTRIVFTGGYRPPRDVNWFIGLGLLLVALVWNFSGYVLRFDASSIWALLVGTNLLKEVPGLAPVCISSSSATRCWVQPPFCVLCLVVFALTLLGLGGWLPPLARSRTAVSLALIGRQRQARALSPVIHPFREVSRALVLTGGLVLLSTFAPPRLGPPADLNHVGSQTVQAPWFFLAIQWLLRYVPPLWAGWMIPLASLVLLAALPLLDRRGPGRGRWFARERWQPQAAFGDC